jgi:hypothetical protein
MGESGGRCQIWFGKTRSGLQRGESEDRGTDASEAVQSVAETKGGTAAIERNDKRKQKKREEKAEKGKKWKKGGGRREEPPSLRQFLIVCNFFRAREREKRSYLVN